jgi:hypothetical protein
VDHQGDESRRREGDIGAARNMRYAREGQHERPSRWGGSIVNTHCKCIRASGILTLCFAITFAVAGGAYCEARSVKHVLFVGNSLISNWNSTAWVGEIANTMGAAALFDVKAVLMERVESLQAHLSATYSSIGLNEIRKGGWDIVVLQENPYEPLKRQEDFYSSITTLAAEARTAGAEVILFEPFSIAAGSVVYYPTELWSGGNPVEMQARLRKSCAQIADRLKLRQARVGDAFEWSLAHTPTIDLYENDKLHPSTRGAYLIACVCAALITGKDPRISSWIPQTGVSQAQARVLRTAASMARTN